MRSIFAFVWQLRRGVVAIAMLYFGVYELYLGTAYHTKRTISYADFAQTMPSVGWYRITGVTLDYTRAVPHETSRGDTEGRYIPAVDPSGKIHLLVVGSEKSEPLFGPDRKTKDIDGTVEFGPDFEPELAKDVRPLQGTVVQNFRVVDEGHMPALWLGLIFGTFGIIIGLLVGLSAIGTALEWWTKKRAGTTGAGLIG
jgi:hypothetical protein